MSEIVKKLLDLVSDVENELGSAMGGQHNSQEWYERHTPGEPTHMERINQAFANLREAIAALQPGEPVCWISKKTLANLHAEHSPGFEGLTGLIALYQHEKHERVPLYTAPAPVAMTVDDVMVERNYAEIARYIIGGYGSRSDNRPLYVFLERRDDTDGDNAPVHGPDTMDGCTKFIQRKGLEAALAAEVG